MEELKKIESELKIVERAFEKFEQSTSDQPDMTLKQDMV